MGRLWRCSSRLPLLIERWSRLPKHVISKGLRRGISRIRRILVGQKMDTLARVPIGDLHGLRLPYVPHGGSALRVKQRYACAKHNTIDRILHAKDISEQLMTV